MLQTDARIPRVLLVPPPELPVPAVQGGAVETLLTHLLRENERCGELELYCASVPDAAAQAAAAFVAECIRLTPPDADERLGVWLESALPQLTIRTEP